MNGNPLLSMMGNNNPMSNNPIMMLVNMMKNGGNPQALVQQMMGQNKEFSNIVNSLNGKDQSQVNQMIANAAKEKNVNLKDLADQLGMPESARKNLGIE